MFDSSIPRTLMKLSELAGYHKNPSIIKERHDAFVREERPFTAAALDFASQELARATADRDRRYGFSASSLGACPRQQQFTWLGLKPLAQSAQRVGVLLNGTFVGLRLQMIGLSEGYLKRAEVPLPKNEYGLTGTMDGELDDGETVVEYKSINARGFNYLKQENAPKAQHVFQAATYLLAAGLSRLVVFYENKDTQDTKEFVVERSQDLELSVLRRSVELHENTDNRKLFPMLPECMEKKGWQYDYCDYKDRCPLIKTFTGAEGVVMREAETIDIY